MAISDSDSSDDDYNGEDIDVVGDGDPLRCGLCGQHFRSEEHLAKHFKQLHERQHKKRKGGKTSKHKKEEAKR